MCAFSIVDLHMRAKKSAAVVVASTIEKNRLGSAIHLIGNSTVGAILRLSEGEKRSSYQKKPYTPPSHWFLPGPERMRGGAARHFASDRHFHRGIQAESTCRSILEKATHYQRLAESRSWRAGFFSESRESTLWKPPCRKPASGSHPVRSH